MNLTNIDWTHRAGTIGTTWNVVTGCNKESRGCKNCYAEVMHKRLMAMGQEKYQQPFLAGPVLHPDLIPLPLSWKKPRTVFVNSMSDLFHKDVPFHFIGMVFNMMAATPQHTYIVLTKRAERMMEFTHWYYENQKAEGFDPFYGALPNVEIGVSVENQEAADLRIPFLLKAVAAIRLLSCEPLVGPVELTQLNYQDITHINCLDGREGFRFPWGEKTNRIDWVIVGGESGHKAEPMHPDWVRKLRDDCEEWDVPFFFKQWGEYLPSMAFYSKLKWEQKGHSWLQGWKRGKDVCIDATGKPCLHGSDFTDAVYPVYPMWKVGKSRSGCELDGVMHKEFPMQVSVP